MFIKNFFKKLGLDSDDSVRIDPFEMEEKDEDEAIRKEPEVIAPIEGLNAHTTMDLMDLISVLHVTPAEVAKRSRELLKSRYIINENDIVIFGEELDVYSCIMKDESWAALAKLNINEYGIVERDLQHSIIIPNSHFSYGGSNSNELDDIKAIVQSDGLFKDIKDIGHKSFMLIHRHLHFGDDMSIRYLNQISFNRFVSDCDDDISDAKLNFLKRQYLMSVGIDSKILDRLEEFNVKLAPFPKFD